MKLSLGTAQLGMHYGISNYKGMLTDREASELLNAAWDNGIRALDTAPVYGLAEQRIAEWMYAHPYRKIGITTKVRQGVRSILDKADCLLWHAFDDDLEYLECTSEIDGISLYTEKQVRRTDFEYYVYQLPANALDGRNDNIIAELKAQAHVVQIRSLLIQGHALQLPFLRGLSSIFSMSVEEICIRWAYELYCDVAIVGMETPKQVEENAESFAKGALPRELVTKIYEIRRKVPEWAISPRTWGQNFAFS